jgi:hypothetical protein
VDRLSETILTTIKSQLEGKRVRLKGYKSLPPFPISDIVGKCDYIGYNSRFPDFGLQITIDRMPCINIKLSQVSLETQN